MDRLIPTRLKNFIDRKREELQQSVMMESVNAPSSSKYSSSTSIDNDNDGGGNLTGSAPSLPLPTGTGVDIKNFPLMDISPHLMQPASLPLSRQSDDDSFFNHVTKLQMSRIIYLEKEGKLLTVQLSNLEEAFQQREQKWKVEQEETKKMVMAELRLLLNGINEGADTDNRQKKELEKKEKEFLELKGKMMAAEMVLDKVLKENRKDEELVKDLQGEIRTLKERAEENELHLKNEVKVKIERIDELEKEVVTLKMEVESAQHKNKRKFAEIRRILDDDECEVEEGEKKKAEATSDGGGAKGVETETAMILFKNKSYATRAKRTHLLKKKESKIGAGAEEVGVNNLQLVPYVNPSARPRPLPRLKCDECPKTFYYQRALQAHKKKFHLEESEECGRCEKTDNMDVFKSSRKLRSRDKKTNTDDDDSKSSNIGGKREKLMKSDKTELPVGGTGCELIPIGLVNSTKSKDLNFSSRGSRARRRWIPLNKFKCRRCPLRFYRFSSWRYHMEKFHSATIRGGAVGCSPCGQFFHTRHQFNKHRSEFHTLRKKVTRKVRRVEEVPSTFTPD
ncbi:unnamed protein product [Orchesella dallaii]|uniref:C2H2-type domain-containing protein n=1 Tax=Orchesella dallaii TaxID=48710 RepID=A0ABP1RT67_9HEXA